MYQALGLMSGTSMDGIDAALIITDGKNHIDFIEAHSLKYESSFQLLLKATEDYIHSKQGVFKGTDLIPGFNSTVQDVVDQSTAYHIKIVENFSQNIDIIGYHGQTFYHNPELKRSVILGNPKQIVDHFGIPVIFDFRSNDMNQGGKGAPLAPIYHKALLKQPTAVVNCGGISNITLIGVNDTLGAFDIGPGNALVDRLVRLKTKGEMMFDQDALFGRHGKIHEDIKQLLWKKSCPKDENFYEYPPPKALDTHDLILIPEIIELSIEDACATLEDFTAYVIYQSTRFMTKIPDLWVLAGGGWNNPLILERLKFYLQAVDVKTADEIGLRSESMEAELFAYLAVRSLQKMPISFPDTTGAPAPLTGGVLFSPTSILHKKCKD